MRHGARRCIFLREKECYVDADEIPLEVCRLCLEFYKIKMSNLSVKSSVKFERECSVTPISRGFLSVDEVKRELRELDERFIEGEIAFGEYIRMRESLLSKILTSKARLAVDLGFIGEEKAFMPIAVVVLEAGMLGFKIKAYGIESEALPEGLNEKFLKQLYRLCTSHREVRSIDLEVGDWRIVSLSFKEGKMALLISSAHVKASRLKNVIGELISVLDRADEWDKAIPEMLEKFSGRKTAIKL